MEKVGKKLGHSSKSRCLNMTSGFAKKRSPAEICWAEGGELLAIAAKPGKLWPQGSTNHSLGFFFDHFFLKKGDCLLQLGKKTRAASCLVMSCEWRKEAGLKWWRKRHGECCLGTCVSRLRWQKKEALWSFPLPPPPLSHLTVHCKLLRAETYPILRPQWTAVHTKCMGTMTS